MNQRRKHSPKFKAKVVLDALSGRSTISELAVKYELHPVQITKWKQAFIRDAPQVFGEDFKRKEAEKDRLIEDLYKIVGKREAELEWLKKKVDTSS